MCGRGAQLEIDPSSFALDSLGGAAADELPSPSSGSWYCTASAAAKRQSSAPASPGKKLRPETATLLPPPAAAAARGTASSMISGRSRQYPAHRLAATSAALTGGMVGLGAAMLVLGALIGGTTVLCMRARQQAAEDVPRLSGAQLQQLVQTMTRKVIWPPNVDTECRTSVKAAADNV